MSLNVLFGPPGSLNAVKLCWRRTYVAITCISVIFRKAVVDPVAVNFLVSETTAQWHRDSSRTCRCLLGHHIDSTGSHAHVSYSLFAPMPAVSAI